MWVRSTAHLLQEWDEHQDKGILSTSALELNSMPFYIFWVSTKRRQDRDGEMTLDARGRTLAAHARMLFLRKLLEGSFLTSRSECGILGWGVLGGGQFCMFFLSCPVPQAGFSGVGSEGLFGLIFGGYLGGILGGFRGGDFRGLGVILGGSWGDLGGILGGSWGERSWEVLEGPTQLMYNDPTHTQVWIITYSRRLPK